MGIGTKNMKSYVIILKGHEYSEQVGNTALTTGNQLGWNTERYDAVDGRQITHAELAKYNISLDRRKGKQVAAMSRPGVFGNFITHWQLWHKCAEMDEPIGVFEHDALFIKPFDVDFKSFGDMLRLSWISQQKDYNTGVCFSGAHAYILKPKGAKKLIKWGKRNGVICADAMMGSLVLDITYDQIGRVIVNPDTIVDGNPNIPKNSLSRGATFA